MKNKRKITVFLAVLLLAATMIPFLPVSAANRETVYQTSFETEDERSGWSFIDGDGDGKTWIVEKSTVSGYESKDGEWLIYSSSKDVADLDNYAISPEIELPNVGEGDKFPNLRLSWYVGADSQYLPNEQYSVYVYDASSGIALSSSNITESATVIKSEVLTEGGYKNYKYCTADLEEYAGKTVQIVFRHHNCDQQVLKIDLIKVEQYFSQKEDVFTEDFENGDFDTEWMKYDKDGDGFCWNASSIGANNGSYSAASKSYFINELNSDNFLISQVIDVGKFGNLQAEWYAGGTDKYCFNEHYRVYVYFGDETEASKIAEECVALTNCSSAEFTLEAYKFREYSLDLNPLVGMNESFRLVFRHYDCTGSFRSLLLDDISVTGVPKRQLIGSIEAKATAPNFDAMASENGQKPEEVNVSLINKWAAGKVEDSVYSVNYKWHKAGDNKEIDSFDFGEEYSVDVTVTINENYSSKYLFTNEVAVENAKILSVSDTEVSFTLDFDAVNTREIKKLSVADIDYALGEKIDAPEITANNCVVSNGAWMASDDSINYSEIKENVFLPNRYYKYSCNVTANKGYYLSESFDLVENITLKDGELMVAYSPLDAKVVNEITVSGITAPTIGETPATDGITVTAYPEGSLSIDPQNIKWVDGDNAEVSGSFEVNKAYALTIPFTVGEIYAVNENTAVSLQEGLNASTALENGVVKITFTELKPIEIEKITLDVGVPRANEVPNKEPILQTEPEIDSNCVTINGEWQVKKGDLEYAAMTADEVFELPEDDEYYYRYVLTLESLKYSVADNAEIYISGYKATYDGEKYVVEFRKADYCKIAFDTNGGSTSDGKSGEITVFVHPGSKIDVPAAPEKTGYRFVGWTEEKDSAVLSTIPETTEVDRTYYAVFTVNQYTIAFEDTGDSTVDAITQDYNSTVTLPASPEKAGYTFTGWKRADGTVLEAGDTFAMPVDGEAVKATWTANEYEAVFDAAGGEFADGKATATIKANFGEAIEAPAAPAKTGYTFKGWTPEVGTMPVGGASFTAVYEANIYNAVFDANGGAWADGDITKKVPTEFNEKIKKPTVPAKTGYTFTGWDVEPDTMDDVNGKKFIAQYELSEEAKVEIAGYVRERTEKYKTTIKFSAKHGTIPNGTSVHWFVNGEDKGTGESYSIKNATSNFTVQIKLMDESREILHESKVETVKIKTGFFDKIVAFFQGLFGSLPNIVQK